MVERKMNVEKGSLELFHSNKKRTPFNGSSLFIANASLIHRYQEGFGTSPHNPIHSLPQMYLA